jgi:phosphate:Na+ symporter
VVPPLAAFALVLGANIGTAINPILEGPAGNDPAARRPPIGNLLTRVLGVACALAVLPYVARFVIVIEPNAARAVADFHTAFNVAIALVFLPLLTPFANLLRRLIPSRIDQTDPSRPIYLDPSAREMPALALGSTAREALRMADVLEGMLIGFRDTLEKGDRKQIGDTRRMDDVLDKLNGAIKTYVTSLDTEAFGDEDFRKAREILFFTTNLEQAGDIIDRNLLNIANKLSRRGLAFSESGRAEIRQMIDRLVANTRTAASLFVTGDERAARFLASEKEEFRAMQSASIEGHFERLRSRRIDTAETSALHLDALRDLKTVNGHIVAAAAYPVLESRGELLPSRLRSTE